MLGLREQIEAAQTPKELQALLSARGSSPHWMASSLGEVAEFFGSATSTIKGWRSDGMPGSDAGWPLDAIVRWRFDRLANNDLTTVRKQQEIELNAIEIDAKRLELSKDRGELVARDDVERWVAMALIATREVFMSQPQTIALAMPPEHRAHALAEADRICRAALTTLRRRLERDQLDEELANGDVAEGDEPNPRIEGTTNDQGT